MYQPDLSPIADSLGLSALVAALPLLTLFVLLGGLRMKAHWAGLVSLAVAVLVAVAGYGMAPGLALLSATQGAAFGLFPIMWIVLAAIWVYQLTVVSGRFEDLRRAFGLISDDPRIQAVIIAFCFGGLLEALAGFGAPVAITGVMLMALGFSPVRAAITVLVANTAPVAFGAIAIPIITAGELTKIPYTEIGAYVGRQTPLLALFVPLLLVALVDGRRGMRQTWPAALVCGAAFGLAQFVSANYISVELTDIIASLFGLAALVVFLRVWKPQGGQDAKASLKAATEKELGTEAAEAQEAANATSDRREGSLLMAFLPYLIIIAIFSLAKLWTPLKEFLASTDVKIPWPGLDGNILNAAGDVVTSTVYTLPWLSSPGTLLLISGVLVALVYKIDPATTVREFGGTVAKLRWALLTVATVLALAYVLNMSGQTITMGTWIAGTGAAFAFLSPILGWLGVAVTGSDTSANALFATLQQAAAAKAGLDPTLLVAANTSGGVVGKMISPQNLTIAATAVGLVGKESQLFRGAIKWSLGLLLAMCVLVYLQSNVLAWMLP
ncbi:MULTISPECIES: L-lactate permease [Streptomyces]|uniref:L-lactate permease n=2 Tax=Streptomyces TaxID=1883 RepID=A0A3R7J237_9ACTN|nr:MULTISPECIES: L-lactate permease [Streptomyces]KNE79877.1 lactate permease [Streptomyces fradiae]OFA39676.1 lactate permease [Streptomyces fradiae]PQM21598.1 L-lactate permease [Streptomyces xinghaiensis]RKM94340.1 L-lactate permease [Streptomyces xinghaiensis]RNC71940.1 L-lactate permease [Streptomyces xinghaiensis]